MLLRYAPARIQAESIVETCRLRLAQRDADAFRDGSNFSFRERLRSKFGNEPIPFCSR